MCVRLCDGYYWPVSNAAPRSRFSRDSSQCSASCESETRLFYMPLSGDPTEMVDQSGRSYTKLPAAFKYRKALDESCRCRARPWDLSERERHLQYAAIEAERRLLTKPDEEVQMARTMGVPEAEARVSPAGLATLTARPLTLVARVLLGERSQRALIAAVGLAGEHRFEPAAPIPVTEGTQPPPPTTPATASVEVAPAETAAVPSKPPRKRLSPLAALIAEQYRNRPNARRAEVAVRRPDPARLAPNGPGPRPKLTGVRG